MEANKENISPSKLRINFEDIKIFALKTAVILIGILILAEFLLPDFSQFEYKIKYQVKQLNDGLKGLDSPKSKLVLLSFVQNPRALLRASEIEEAEGKIDNAIRETDLAIGLLEMHGADKQVIHRYEDRLNKLTIKKSNMAATLTVK